MPLSYLKNLPKFSKEEQKYFDSLMAAREIVLTQMNHHASVALNNGGTKHGAVTHMADYGGENFRRDIELQMLTEDGNVLELIEDAIKRLVNGEFGKCVDCSENISKGRLEVKPYALYCTKCKAIREANNGINPNVD
ncbi:MAG: TraR/DksA C4-type zinc finger protein [Victivallaceae bacterium]|nr:TraR/DksA C4-type zinc finger protein [Victivallaceae bacterium]